MSDEHDPSGPLFWTAAAIGLALVAFGLVGLLRAVDGEALRSWATLLAAGLVVHDAILAPLVTLVGLLLARLLPRWARPPLLAGLVVSAIVLVVAFPLVWPEHTRLANNRSLLPGDYDRALLLVLAAVWLVALSLCATAWRARRRRAARE